MCILNPAIWGRSLPGRSTPSKEAPLPNVEPASGSGRPRSIPTGGPVRARSRQFTSSLRSCVVSCEAEQAPRGLIATIGVGGSVLASRGPGRTEDTLAFAPYRLGINLHRVRCPLVVRPASVLRWRATHDDVGTRRADDNCDVATGVFDDAGDEFVDVGHQHVVLAHPRLDDHSGRGRGRLANSPPRGAISTTRVTGGGSGAGGSRARRVDSCYHSRNRSVPGTM